jgi:hypothetical protein
MKEQNKKPSARGDPADSPYEELCGKTLTKEQEAEINFNLVNFVETLIAMDRQHQEWIKNQKEQTKETT